MLFHDIFILLLGLVLIIIGGNAVTDGAVSIAHKFKLSPLIIGLTVVAFGSSTPDLVVCMISTIKDHSELAIGDIVGSGIFDLFLVAGVIALISPITFSNMGRKFNIPMLFLSSLILFLMGDDRVVDRTQVSAVDRTDGLMLLLVFAFYIWYLIKNSHEDSPTDSAPAPAPHTSSAPVKRVKAILWRVGWVRHISREISAMPLWLAAIYVAAGLACLVSGGNWLVDGASGIALKCGMSEAMVGLTIVGIGSGIPDLASSVIAALKKQTGLAIGNIVGACIFNVFFIIGACATIKPVHSENITTIDFMVLLLASFLLLAFATFTRSHRLNRSWGALLVSLYLCYIAYLVLSALHIL